MNKLFNKNGKNNKLFTKNVYGSKLFSKVTHNNQGGVIENTNPHDKPKYNNLEKNKKY
jgi:hypothetical protein